MLVYQERLFLTRGLITFFLFASFGTVWSGLSLPLTGAPWHLSADRPVRRRGTRGSAERGPGRTAGRRRIRRPGDQAGARLAPCLLGSDRATAMVAVAARRRNRPARLRGPGRARQQPAPAHHGSPGSHQQRHRRLHGLYALGSALGAAATTAVFGAAGWAGSSVLGAVLAACALAVWALDRRVSPARSAGSQPRSSDNSKKSPLNPTCRAQPAQPCGPDRRAAQDSDRYIPRPLAPRTGTHRLPNGSCCRPIGCGIVSGNG